jgi:hypothetical protein
MPCQRRSRLTAQIWTRLRLTAGGWTEATASAYPQPTVTSVTAKQEPEA